MNQSSNDPKNMKSVGVLFPAKKTKSKSPDMTGEIKIQFDDFQRLSEDIRKPGDVVVGNIAAWCYKDARNRPYVSVQITPRFRPKVQEPEPVKGPTLDQFFADVIRDDDEPIY